MAEREQAALRERLAALKRERKAILLVHNYQNSEVQDVADLLGDSLGLSRQAAATEAEVIVFCGVHFMAETAKILAPEKTVILPEPRAGCPMAEMVDVEGLRTLKAQHPGATVVCYVNSSAAVKAESDICCTSANAVRVVAAVESEEIIFVPDRNLGSYAAEQTGKKLILWEGYCNTHQRVTPEDVARARAAHPGARVVVHPECRPEVVALADAVESTEGIIRYVQREPAREFLIGTEMGLLHRLEREAPEKRCYLLTPGLVCPNMKMTTLAKVVRALERLEPQIEVPEEIRRRARKAVERMLSL